MEILGCEKDEEGRVLMNEKRRPVQRYRLVDSAPRVNAATIRDASLLPAVGGCSERFA